MASVFKRVDGGKTVWRAQIRRKGFPVLCEKFPSKAAANRWAREKESRIAELRRDAGENAMRVCVWALIERYENRVLAHRAGSDNTVRAQRCHLAFWRRQIGAAKAADVDTALLAEAREKLLDGGKRKNSTVNRYMSTLSVLFGVAMAEWKCAVSNPCKTLARLREEDTRNSYAESADIARLLAAAADDKDDYILIFLRVALSTGARKSEITLIQSRFIYPSLGMVRLVETKSGKERMIYPDAATMNMLAALKARGGEYAFAHPRTGKPYDNRRAWERVRAKAGMRHYRMHDNRHTFATHIGMSGAPATDIAALTGHKKLDNVLIYTHFAQSHLAQRAAGGQALMFEGEVCR